MGNIKSVATTLTGTPTTKTGNQSGNQNQPGPAYEMVIIENPYIADYSGTRTNK